MNKNAVNTIKPVANSLVEERLVNFRAAEAMIHKLWLSAQRELEQAKRTRVEAERYLKETAARANSQAQQLLLGTRIDAYNIQLIRIEHIILIPLLFSLVNSISPSFN